MLPSLEKEDRPEELQPLLIAICPRTFSESTNSQAGQGSWVRAVRTPHMSPLCLCGALVVSKANPGDSSQVSTNISTTCSNSARSDLQLEAGGGAAAAKPSSPSQRPGLALVIIPVSTVSRS